MYYVNIFRDPKGNFRYSSEEFIADQNYIGNIQALQNDAQMLYDNYGWEYIASLEYSPKITRKIENNLL